METQLSKYHVESLQVEDINWFVEVAATRMLLEELKRPHLVNLSQLYSLTAKVVEGDSAFVVKCNGVPVGAIAGLIVPNIYNPTITEFIELFWYVLPAHRASRAGLLLLNRMIERGEEAADATTISLLKDSPINFKTLEKRGFKNVESGFIKERNR
jgi:hypothetical protein